MNSVQFIKDFDIMIRKSRKCSDLEKVINELEKRLPTNRSYVLPQNVKIITTILYNIINRSIELKLKDSKYTDLFRTIINVSDGKIGYTKDEIFEKMAQVAEHAKTKQIINFLNSVSDFRDFNKKRNLKKQTPKLPYLKDDNTLYIPPMPSIPQYDVLTEDDLNIQPEVPQNQMGYQYDDLPVLGAEDELNLMTTRVVERTDLPLLRADDELNNGINTSSYLKKKSENSSSQSIIVF